MTDLNPRHIHLIPEYLAHCVVLRENILGGFRAILAVNTGNVSERSLLSACKIA